VPANSLVLLMLLALGTFLAGINLLSFEICFLGPTIALSVPAIAWLKQSALFLLLAAVLLVGLGITFWEHRATKCAKPGRAPISYISYRFPPERPLRNGVVMLVSYTCQ
jgi:hypothetical protein